MQVNTRILTQDALEQISVRCKELASICPQQEGRPPRDVSRISNKSKAGFKGDDLRRLLNGYLTFAYMDHVPRRILQLFMLLEVQHVYEV